MFPTAHRLDAQRRLRHFGAPSPRFMACRARFVRSLWACIEPRAMLFQPIWPVVYQDVVKLRLGVMKLRFIGDLKLRCLI